MTFLVISLITYHIQTYILKYNTIEVIVIRHETDLMCQLWPPPTPTPNLQTPDLPPTPTLPLPPTSKPQTYLQTPCPKQTQKRTRIKKEKE